MDCVLAAALRVLYEMLRASLAEVGEYFLLMHPVISVDFHSPVRIT